MVTKEVAEVKESVAEVKECMLRELSDIKTQLLQLKIQF